MTTNSLVLWEARAKRATSTRYDDRRPMLEAGEGQGLTFLLDIRFIYAIYMIPNIYIWPESTAQGLQSLPLSPQHPVQP